MTRIKSLALAALLGASVVAPMAARADGARDWLNLPVDMNFVFLYYSYSNNETSINSPLPIEGAEVSAQVPILRYARTFDIGGRIAGFQLVLPYAFIDAELTGTGVKRSIDGVGDITAIFISNIYGAPALSREAFATWTPGEYLTGAVSVTMPTGDYDPGRLINPGKNRWAVKPQLAWGTPIDRATWFTINGALELYQDNDEYFGGRTLSQNPLGTIDVHYSKNLNKAVWVSADAIYTFGGETKIDGVKQDNEQSTLRLGLSGSMNFSATDAVSVAVTRTVAKESHTADATTFQISYSKAW